MVFSHLPSLQTLNLNRLSLTTLRPDIFNPADYPDSNGRPPRLELWLEGNRLQCNTSLCWLKEAVENGSIYFPSDGSPKCYNSTEYPFESVTLDCTSGKHLLSRSNAKKVTTVSFVFVLYCFNPWNNCVSC